MTTTDAEVQETETQEKASSFAKSLFLGEIHEDLVFPYPYPDEVEGRKVKRIVNDLKEFAKEYDERAVEEARWVPDEVITRLGEIGALGPLRAREVRGPGPLADRLRARLRADRAARHHALGRPRRPPVDRLQGHRGLRLRRAEGALAAGPRDRPQARRPSR